MGEVLPLLSKSMKMTPSQIFCDFLTVSQYHDTPHPAFNAGIRTTIDASGDITQISPVPFSLSGQNGSNLQISSDGHKVYLSGNPSRWNRSENYYGLSLDQAKIVANKILESVGLPTFTNGEILQHTDGTQKYTGAQFSRIDMTANIKTGSPSNAKAYLQHQATQEYPRLKKHLYENTVYYGLQSDSRTIIIYDKAQQLRALHKKDMTPYMSRLIDWLEKNGVIRFEIKYLRYLRNKNLRYWHRVTQERLSIEIEMDINLMTQEIEVPDYGDIPGCALGTLGIYIMGLDVKKHLKSSTYYRHRKILKKFGYDISNQNIHLLQPKVKIITLEPAGVPDFYKHATGEI